MRGWGQVGGTFFLFAAFLCGAFGFSLFCVPETKGVALQGIEKMFAPGHTWASLSQSAGYLSAIVGCARHSGASYAKLDVDAPADDSAA